MILFFTILRAFSHAKTYRPLCNTRLCMITCPLSPSSIIWYRPKGGDDLCLGRWSQAWQKVMAGYHWVHDYVTCELTAWRPGSAPDPTLVDSSMRLPSSFTFAACIIWTDNDHVKTTHKVNPKYRSTDAHDSMADTIQCCQSKIKHRFNVQ